MIGWSILFTALGIVGGELAAWLHHHWLDRHRPTMSIEDATEQIMAELAEHRRMAEEAMWQITSNNDD